MKMRGQVRPQGEGDGAPLSSKRRKTHENEKASKEPGATMIGRTIDALVSAGGKTESTTPVKDRRIWSQEEEMDLLKVLLEDKRAGRTIPLQSKAATYWTDLISLLYPGENGVTQRRLYDKVRRMHQRYNEIQETKTPCKNTREKSLFEFWEKIFVDEIDTKKAVQEKETVTEKQVPDRNPIKLVEVSDSEEEEDDEEEEHEEQAPTAKDTPKAGPSAQESSGSEEEDEDDDGDDDENESSPEKGRPVPSDQNIARPEPARAAQEELRKTALPAEENPKAASKFPGVSKKVSRATECSPNVENGKRRSKGGAEQARLEADMIRSLKAELFEYVHNIRKDCMRELDEVRGQLMSPARLQLARRQQELILEEFSLQEKELEISQRFCRLQKEALKLRNAS